MGKIIGAMIGLIAVVGAGVLLLGQLNKGGDDEPLVNCDAIPNPAPHDKEFHFYLDLNGKNKNSGNFELDSVAVSDGGIAVNSNVGNLVVSGPFHAGLVDTVSVNKNTIAVIPVKDERDQIEQEISWHVAAKLKRKKGGAITTTSTICKATIVHTHKQAPPVKSPENQPKPKPPILYKDKTGNWVEPPKKTPATQPGTDLKKTPSFETKYGKYVTDNITQFSLVVTPKDLAGKTIAGIEIALAQSTYSLPSVDRTTFNLNEAGWYKADWQCNNTGTVLRCTGSDVMQEGKHSVVALDFNALIDTPPAVLNAALLNVNGETVADVEIQFRPVE